MVAPFAHRGKQHVRALMRNADRRDADWFAVALRTGSYVSVNFTEVAAFELQSIPTP